MKKVFLGLAVLAALGLVASQGLAWSPYYGGCSTWGPGGGGYSGDVNPGPAERNFLKETERLRKDLAGKEAEYDALMAQPSPDPKRAAQLSQEIFEIGSQLRAKARSYGFSRRGPRGYWHGGHMGPRTGGSWW